MIWVVFFFTSSNVLRLHTEIFVKYRPQKEEIEIKLLIPPACNTNGRKSASWDALNCLKSSWVGKYVGFMEVILNFVEAIPGLNNYCVTTNSC